MARTGRTTDRSHGFLRDAKAGLGIGHAAGELRQTQLAHDDRAFLAEHANNCRVVALAQAGFSTLLLAVVGASAAAMMSLTPNGTALQRTAIDIIDKLEASARSAVSAAASWRLHMSTRLSEDLTAFR